ncbi:MAG: DUF4292 domain-containing protein [Candidatus Azobacteroides sp.]|nr:DUF4292 domain-containing protein [Candidatus Azobacteroides sp.]
MIKRNIYHIFLISSLLLFLNACKTTRETIQVTGTLEDVSVDEYFERLVENQLDYKTLTYKLNVELNNGGKTISSKATLKMEKDKVIQISFQPFLGAELFRVQFRPDSVIAIDRLNKRYVAESMSVFTERNASIDFNAIQSLFTNNLFIPGKDIVKTSDKKSFDIKKQTEDKMLLTLKNSKKMDYLFTGGVNNHISSTFLGDKSANFALTWNYADFESFSGLVFPSRMELHASGKGKDLNSVFSITKIEKNTKSDFDYSIPAKYTRMDIDALFKLLGQ